MKDFKGNFLPGRDFVDDVHLHEQLAEWMPTIADVRIHGTTHERPIDRFAQEQLVLLPTTSQPSFRLEAPLARIVADDWLVSVDTNRYSVPFMLIGQPVEVHRRNGRLRILHRGAPVAEHPELLGKHQVRILPEHGPGASARTARRQHSTPSPTRSTMSATGPGTAGTSASPGSRSPRSPCSPRCTSNRSSSSPSGRSTTTAIPRSTSAARGASWSGWDG